MKSILSFLTMVIATTAVAIPTNNPVVKPSTWNGYGVDWCDRSIRIGLDNADSLLEDGWALIDSLNLKYGEIDSLNVTNFGADTVSTIYLFADTASVTTALDTPNLVTFGGGNIENLANIFRFEPVTNKGYIQYNNSTHAFSIRQDSTIVAGNTNIDLNFIEEDNTTHYIQWYDASNTFYTPETFRALHLWASSNLYLGGGQIGVATILTEPAGHYWAGLCTVNNSYDGVLLDPNIGGQDTVKVGVTGDNDIFVSECSENWFDADLKITDYSLTAGALVSETVDARPISMQWTGQITEADFVAASTQEDVLIISDFPPKYKITSILIDITQVFDDGAGAISGASMSFGPTADPTSYLDATDVYTAVTRIGDAAGEIAYTAVQGGVIPSWTATTNLYVRLRTEGGNTADCTTGVANIYITYLAIE